MVHYIPPFTVAAGLAVWSVLGPWDSVAAEPQGVRQFSGEEGKKTSLEGEWVVFSANYALSGPVYYTFRGNQLTIEAWTSTEKRVDAPRMKSVEKWRVEIDESRSPARLLLKSI